tara:strand:- start:1593 stop:2501 length:909 start_codon:yes stop_codon:yes gene_type:complete
MAENTSIEWATHTFNPWEGCQKLGPGCDHCFAEARNARFGGGVAANWGPGAPRRRTSDANWRKPLHWQAEAARTGIRPRVFCASLADVFDNAVHPDWRSDLFELIHRTPDLDWLLLTKRVGNVARMIWADGEMTALPANVWLGATIVNQEEAERDIPKLAAIDVTVRFLSMEPLLGPVDLSGLLYHECPNWIGEDGFPPRMDMSTGAVECCSRCDFSGIGDELAIHWVIVGGESGPGARLMQPEWARSLRDQCAAAGVPFLFKQWGAWAPLPSARDADQLYLTTKKAAGRLLDGVHHDGMPT